MIIWIYSLCVCSIKMEDLPSIVILTYIALCLVITSTGILIGYKLYHNINDEEFRQKGKVIQRILKNYCIVQCISWPFILILSGVVSTVIRSSFIISHPSATVWSIHVAELIIKFTFLYAGFNSFIIGLCRYVFIIVVTHNEANTINRIRKLILAASIVFPATLTVLDVAFMPMAEMEIHLMPHQVDMMETITLSNSAYVIHNTTLIIPRSPFYTIARNSIPQFLLYPIKCVAEFITFVVCSNIIEGGFYTHIFWYHKR